MCARTVLDAYRVCEHELRTYMVGHGQITCERATKYFDCGSSCNARKLWRWLVAFKTYSVSEDSFNGFLAV
jgi:hypothetical protein